MKTESDARSAKEALKRQFRDSPLDEYVASVGISKVKFFPEGFPEERHDESCVSVTLLKELPEGLSLPKEYEGVAVISTVTGSSRPYQGH